MRTICLLVMFPLIVLHGLSTHGEDSAPEEDKSVKLTFLISGAHCERCVSQVRKSLEKLPGIKFEGDDITAGEKPKYFSDPFVVTILDRRKTIVGAVAAAVTKAMPPHRAEFPPAVNIVLHTQDTIDEPYIQELRRRMRQVNGLVVDLPGSLGGMPRKGLLWIRLEEAGGAELNQILEAVREQSENISLVKKEAL